jgi:type IV secretion system protein TrbL
MSKNIKSLSLATMFLILIFAPSISDAAVFLDHVASAFQSGTMKWQATITLYAESLFWKLVMIDFTWTTIVWVKDRKEIGELLMGYVGKILTIGFFWMALEMGSTWVPAIIGSFVQIGKDTAFGADSTATVGTLDSILFAGFDYCKAMISALMAETHWYNPIDRLCMLVSLIPTATIVSLGFALIAGQVLVALIESYIAISAGIILLGFGGSRWTSDIASSYLKFAVGTGVKLMLCYLIVGLGFNVFVSAIPSKIVSGEFLQYMFTIIPMTLIYVYLVFNIPGLASSMMSGSPNMSLGGMAGAGITAAAGVAGAGAAVQAFGGSKVGGAMGEAIKGSLPGNGQMQAVNASAINGGGGGSPVQAPGSGLSATPSGGSSSGANMPGATKTGALAASFADSAASPMSAMAPQDGSAASGGVSAPQTSVGSAPASTSSSSSSPSSAPSISAGGIDLGTSPSAAKAAAASSSAATPAALASPVAANHSGGGTAPAGLSVVSGASSAPSDSGGSSANPGAVTTGAGANVGAGAVDASGASITASDPHTELLTAISKNIAQMANAPENSAKLHDKISAMQKFVPNDAATIQTPGISMGHTRD